MTRSTVDLAYDASGDASGPPLVLLHGYPLSRAIWSPVMQDLAQVSRVIAPDLRGHGASPLPTLPPNAKATVDGYAEDVLALSDKLGFDRFDLAAHSMGGYVAFALLRIAPERVRRLVLVTTRANADSEEAKAARRKQADMAHLDGVRAIANTLVPKLLAPTANDILREEVRRVVEGSPVSGIVHALEAMRERPDSSDLLAGVKQPTLLVAGSDDVLMPRSEQHRMRDALPDARLEVLEGAAHLPMMEQPAAFARVVSEFLKQP